MWSKIRIPGNFDRGIWVITLIGFLNSAAFAVSLPFLALYLYGQRGLSMFSVGLIILISGLCAAATQLVAGSLSDKLGRRPMLLYTVAASAAAYAGMGALIAYDAPLAAIITVYCVVRSALMMMRPPITAMIADISRPDRLTESYGLLRVGQNLGWGAGPAIGGYLLISLPYSWLFGLAGGILIIAFLVVQFTVRESMKETSPTASVKSLVTVFKDSRFLGFTLLAFLFFLVMSQMGSTLSVFTVERLGFTTAQFGLLVGFNGLLVVALQYPMARLLRKDKRHTALVIGCLLYAVGFLLFGWIAALGPALMAMTVITLGEITFTPSAQALAGELSPREWRGRYMASFTLSETLGISCGPLVGGILLDHSPAPVLWGTIAGVVFIAAIGFVFWRRRFVAPKQVPPV